MRRFRKKNRVDIAGGRPQIPAFAGMTKRYSTGIVFYNSVTSANRPTWREPTEFLRALFHGPAIAIALGGAARGGGRKRV